MRFILTNIIIPYRLCNTCLGLYSTHVIRKLQYYYFVLITLSNSNMARAPKVRACLHPAIAEVPSNLTAYCFPSFFSLLTVVYHPIFHVTHTHTHAYILEGENFHSSQFATFGTFFHCSQLAAMTNFQIRRRREITFFHYSHLATLSISNLAPEGKVNFPYYQMAALSFSNIATEGNFSHGGKFFPYSTLATLTFSNLPPEGNFSHQREIFSLLTVGNTDFFKLGAGGEGVT